MRPARGVSSAQECSEARIAFAEAVTKVNGCLAQIAAAIQPLTDPDEVCTVMKNGYLEAVQFMCSTLDYANNIWILSRATKTLKEAQAEPQEAAHIDIFGRIERMSHDFILRLRQHEMEHTHVEERLAGVSKEQAAIQKSILHQLAQYEKTHKNKYGEDLLTQEFNFAQYFR